MKIVIDRERITWRKLREELVLMHLDTGAYYSLNDTGILIWESLADGQAYDSIVDAIVKDFEVDRETVIKDFERLVNELADQGLVEIMENDA